MNLRDKLWKELVDIPKGEVRTYKELAKRLGTGPRVIARLISTNPHPVEVPCHRVVRNDGNVGGYTYRGELNPQMKIRLLREEGVEIINGKVISLP